MATTIVHSNELQDLRKQFLSVENLNLLNAVIRFASQYVCGLFCVNNRDVEVPLKSPDKLIETYCDACHLSFVQINSPSLYCVIDKKIERKFLLVCDGKRCFEKYAQLTARYYTIMLYPVISLNDVEILCRQKFLTRYMFPFDAPRKFQDIVLTKETERKIIYDDIKLMIARKIDNEHIVSVKVSNYRETLLSETPTDYCLHHDKRNNTVKLHVSPKPSAIKNFFESSHTLAHMTYFIKIIKRQYIIGGYDSYYVFFPKPDLNYNLKNFHCAKCLKKKMYKKKYPVLYCSYCCYTDNTFFVPTFDFDKLNFDPTRIISKVSSNRSMIIYYKFD